MPHEPNKKFLDMIAEGSSECWLAIDHRERAILTHSEHFDHIPYRPMQMTVGDYAICKGNKILAVIERKSLEDYAASFKDGRHDNRNKMTKLRDEIGCRVIYIVEGQYDPSPDKMIGRILYKHIENSIYHIMIRDHILVLRTKDPLDTSKKLARFVESMITLEWEPAEIMDLTTGVEVVGGDDLKTAHVNDILTADRSKSDSDILREMWACFRGITTETAAHYIRRWSLAEVILKKIPVTGPGSPSVIKINNRHITKLTQEQLLNVPNDVRKKMLSRVQGISDGTAGEILDQMALDVLLEIGLDEVKVLKVGKAKKALGEVKAKKILKLFTDSEKVTV